MECGTPSTLSQSHYSTSIPIPRRRPRSHHTSTLDNKLSPASRRFSELWSSFAQSLNRHQGFHPSLPSFIALGLHSDPRCEWFPGCSENRMHVERGRYQEPGQGGRWRNMMRTVGSPTFAMFEFIPLLDTLAHGCPYLQLLCPSQYLRSRLASSPSPISIAWKPLLRAMPIFRVISALSCYPN